MRQASRSSFAKASMYTSQLAAMPIVSSKLSGDCGDLRFTTFLRMVLDSSLARMRATVPGFLISRSSRYAPNAIDTASGSGNPTRSGTVFPLGVYRPQGQANHTYKEPGMTIGGKSPLHYAATVAQRDPLERADRAPMSPAGALELFTDFFGGRGGLV